jgi:tetratricopeptide (TPR) repeat protein
MKNYILVLAMLISGSHLLFATSYSKADSILIEKYYDSSGVYIDRVSDTAFKYINIGMKLSSQYMYVRGIANGYFYIALFYETKEKLDSGIFYYQKALVIYEQLDAFKSCGIVLSNMGDLYNMHGKIDESFKTYNNSLFYMTKAQFKEGMAKISIRISYIYTNYGNLESAAKYSYKVLSISESIKDTIGIASAYQQLGDIFLRQNNFEKAKGYFNRSLQIIKDDNSYARINSLGSIYNNLGNVDSKCGLYKSSFIMYEKGLKYYERIKNSHGLANIYSNMGELFNRQKLYRKALYYSTKSIEISRMLDDKSINTWGKYNRGSIYRGMKNYDSAFYFFKETFREAEKFGQKVLLKGIAEELSQTYEAVGDYKNALKYYKKFKMLSDSLNNDEITRRINTNELQYEFDKKENELLMAQQQKELELITKIEKQQLIVKIIIGFSVLILLLLFAGFGFYRNRQLAKYRALEIDLNHSIQQALSQQINPHFIFNCLNSIKALILENKIEETELYFGVFAGLMRKNLEYSQSAAIPINSEIEALELYVRLEQLRFNHKFSFETEIDLEIDQYNCKIPSLILQPFVENAIIHAFKNREKGIIRLKMSLQDNEIYCVVEDDGGGRQHFNENSDKPGHKSIGMSLTQKRLDLIYQLYGPAKKLAVIDKKNLSGESTGTIVEFGLPIIIN